MKSSVLAALLYLAFVNLDFVTCGGSWGYGNLKRRRIPPPGMFAKRRARPGSTRIRPKTGIHRRQSVHKDTVHFYIYPDPIDTHYREEIVVGNNASISRYRGDYYPILLIPGYNQNFSSLYPQRTKDAYLRQGTKANVIIMDWQSFAQPNYGKPTFGHPNNMAKQIGKVSKHLSDFLMFLMTQKVLKDSGLVHIVGFGLGAQIAGVTGHSFKRATGLQVGRITALDPSGLQYSYTAISQKLDKSDASFVSVIHTTSGPFGFGSSIGHVDFYPNGGGPSQPGCQSLFEIVKDIPGREGSSCSHQRAWEYFTDSIYNKDLYACQSSSFMMYKMKNFCTKPVLFGEYTLNTAKGDYFLELIHKD